MIRPASTACFGDCVACELRRGRAGKVPTMWALRCDEEATLAASSRTEFSAVSTCKHTNFPKACRWSPDGTSLLTASDDDVLRVYPLEPEVAEAAVLRASDTAEADADAACSRAPPATEDDMKPAARISQGECIYDMDWYPAYNTSSPETCCFASTSRAHPVSLWDAGTGLLRTTYRVYDDADEVTAAYCIKFHSDCGRCGHLLALVHCRFGSALDNASARLPGKGSRH